MPYYNQNIETPDGQIDRIKLNQNFNQTNEYINDVHYHKWLGPGDFILNNATSSLINTRTAVISMADASTSNAATNLHRPSLWIDGDLDVVLYYSSDGVSTNNFHIVVDAQGISTGSSINTTKQSAQNLAGAGTAEELSSATFSSIDTIVSTDDIIRVRVSRGGNNPSDDNTDTFYFVCLHLIYVPNKI